MPLFLFFGVIGFGIFALMFLVMGLRDSRDAILCKSIGVGSVVLSAACAVLFALVMARTDRKEPASGSFERHLEP